MNLNWRIEQEIKVDKFLYKNFQLKILLVIISWSKTYHKTNDERKFIQQEICETKNQLNEIKDKIQI